MSKFQHILVVLLLFVFIKSYGQENDAVNIRFDRMVQEEVNFLRTNPTGYAEERLNADFENGDDNGAYRFLKKMKPVKGLALNDTLSTLAINYAKLISFKKTLSHNLNSTPMKRANKAGYFGMIGENLAAGSDEKYNARENPQTAAVEFVKMLVIDKGIKDYGHRRILTEPRFKELGVGFHRNPNDKLKNYFVQEFGNQEIMIK